MSLIKLKGVYVKKNPIVYEKNCEKFSRKQVRKIIYKYPFFPHLIKKNNRTLFLLKYTRYKDSKFLKDD